MDFNLRQLEDADDGAEGPMMNSWITTDRAAATRALNQDVGDVNAPSLQGDGAVNAPAEPPPVQRSTAYARSADDVSPSILIHHEQTNVVSPADHSGSVNPSPLHADSATMTTLAAATTSAPRPLATESWDTACSQTSFDQSVQADRPCSSYSVDEGTLPTVPEVSQDDVFVAPSSPFFVGHLPRRSTSTTATARSTTVTAASTTASAPDPEDPDDYLRGQKVLRLSGDTSYSRHHRARLPGPSNYPKRPLRQQPTIYVRGR